MMPEDYSLGSPLRKENSCIKLSFYLRHLKPVCDWALVALTLPVTLPVLVMLALAIKCTSPGPAFLRIACTAQGGRGFAQWRFRCVSIEATRHNKKPDLTWEADPRVTPLGRFLLRMRLNQLPQIFNILSGDMALVGPRAHPHRGAQRADPASQLLRPGLIDPADICRAQLYDVTDPEAISCAYVLRASFWLDLRIVLAAWKSSSVK